MPSNKAVRVLQAKKAAAARWNPNEAADASRRYAVARIADWVERELAKAPELTDADRADLARLFSRGGAA